MIDVHVLTNSFFLLFLILATMLLTTCMRAFIEAKQINTGTLSVIVGDMRLFLRNLREHAGINFVFHLCFLVGLILIGSRNEGDANNLELGLFTLLWLFNAGIDFFGAKNGNQHNLLIRHTIYGVIILVALASFQESTKTPWTLAWFALIFLALGRTHRDYQLSSHWQGKKSYRLINEIIFVFCSLWLSSLLIEYIFPNEKELMKIVMAMCCHLIYSFFLFLYSSWRIVRHGKRDHLVLLMFCLLLMLGHFVLPLFQRVI